MTTGAIVRAFDGERRELERDDGVFRLGDQILAVAIRRSVEREQR